MYTIIYTTISYGPSWYTIPKTLISFLFLFTSLSTNANALVPTYSNKVAHVCQNETIDSNQRYKLSTSSLLSDLVAHSSNTSFYSSSSSASGPNSTIHGLFYCTANVASYDCHSCVQSAASDLQLNCPLYKEAAVFYSDCTLVYSNTTAHPDPEESMGASEYTVGLGSSVYYTGFNETLYATLSSLITKAAYGSGSKGYASGDSGLAETSRRLYALAQCTPDILGSSCEECLDVALKFMPRCCYDGIWGSQKSLKKIFLENCQLRYEVKYPSTTSSDGIRSYSPGKMVWYIIYVAMAGAALAFY